MPARKKRRSSAPRTGQRKTQKRASAQKMDENVRNTILSILLFGAAVCMIICFIAPTAPLCTAVNSFIYGMFGVCGIAVPLVLIITGLFLILRYDRVGARLGWMALMLFLIDSLVNVFSFVYDAQTQKTVLDGPGSFVPGRADFPLRRSDWRLDQRSVEFGGRKDYYHDFIDRCNFGRVGYCFRKDVDAICKNTARAPRSTAGAPCAYGETAGRI